jgi:hypothetical protein
MLDIRSGKIARARLSESGFNLLTTQPPKSHQRIHPTPGRFVNHTASHVSQLSRKPVTRAGLRDLAPENSNLPAILERFACGSAVFPLRPFNCGQRETP